MIAEKKHLRFVFMTDTDWNRITSVSVEKRTSKSDALSSLLKSPEESTTSYSKLVASLEIIQDAIGKMEPPKSITFRECAEIYLDDQRRQNKSSTVRTHKEPLECRILKVFGDRQMTDITRQELVDYVNSLVAEELSPSYINQILGTIKQIFGLAKINGYIKEDVSETVKRVPEEKSDARNTYHRCVSKFDLDLFLKELAHEHLYLFIMFMLYTGMRFGEVAALKADDISFDKEYIYIKRTMITDEDNHVVMSDSTKTKSSTRKIPLSRKLKELLSQIEMPSDGSTIFKSARGQIVSNASANRTIRNTIKRVKEKHGVEIEHFTTHALRDTFATYYAEANADKGGDVKTLQELLGHAKMSITTDLYMHALDENKVSGMERVGAML